MYNGPKDTFLKQIKTDDTIKKNRKKQCKYQSNSVFVHTYLASKADSEMLVAHMADAPAFVHFYLFNSFLSLGWLSFETLSSSSSYPCHHTNYFFFKEHFFLSWHLQSVKEEHWTGCTADILTCHSRKNLLGASFLLY